MSLDHLIAPEHLHFEHSLIEDPDHEETWLNYAETVAGNREKSEFVLERATQRLPASVLLWNAYFAVPWTDKDDRKLISIYRRALVSLGASPAIFTRFLALLQKSGTETELTQALNLALFSLDKKYHGPIWKLYLNYGEKVGGLKGAQIYYRFLSVVGEFQDGPEITADEVLMKLVEFRQFELAVKAYAELPKKHLLKLPSLVASEFLDALSQSKGFTDSKFFESLALESALLYPDLRSSFSLKLAEYHETRGSIEKAIHEYYAALEASATVNDATHALDKLARCLEDRIAVSSENEEILRHRLEIYDKLLEDRALYVNDVKLRQNVNNIDIWLERTAILAERNRQTEMLSTYVRAITSINPLKAVSLEFNMATVWIRYANVYIAQSDFSTANLIFSRAVKLQFRTVEELVEIHLAWAEIMLETSDEAALSHVKSLLDISEDFEKDDIEFQIAKLPKLWEFRLDLLRAILNSNLHNPKLILGDMIDKKVITLRILLDYANDLKSENKWEQYFSALELGLGAFVLPEAKSEIWAQYLPDFVAHTENKEKIREIFEKCLGQIPLFSSGKVFSQFSQFEIENGNVTKAVRILRLAITNLTQAYNENLKLYKKTELNQMADAKFEIYKKLLDSVANLKDLELSREIFTLAVEDQHLTTPQIIDLLRKFINFEISNREFLRARGLFRYATGLVSPQQHMVKSVWRLWEEFEIEHGSEATYKEMLKFKRNIAKEFENLQEAKSSVNPMGFTKASSTVEPQANPDAIDLDMDM